MPFRPYCFIVCDAHERPQVLRRQRQFPGEVLRLGNVAWEPVAEVKDATLFTSAAEAKQALRTYPAYSQENQALHVGWLTVGSPFSRPSLTTESTTEIEEALARHGFALEHTGGNCCAYIKREPDGFQTWIGDGDFGVPTDLGDSVEIWEGTQADCDAGNGYSLTGYVLDDVLRALCNPSTEYALLSLRLLNGLHHS